MSKDKILWMWHEPSNTMALAHIRNGLPVITVCDDTFEGINPFYSYPINYLKTWVGWVELGEF